MQKLIDIFVLIFTLIFLNVGVRGGVCHCGFVFVGYFGILDLVGFEVDGDGGFVGGLLVVGDAPGGSDGSGGGFVLEDGGERVFSFHI